MKSVLTFSIQTCEFRSVSFELNIVSSPENETMTVLLLKSTAVNSDKTATNESSVMKHLSHVKILTHITDTSDDEVKTFLCVKIFKRRHKNDNSDLNELMTKIFKVMLALTALTANDEISLSLRADILTSVTYIKAVRDLVWKKTWKKVIHTELITLATNSTWEEVVLSKNVNIVISKWVFKLKLHTDDFLDKLKVRVVIKDFSQMYSVDYKDTFAPTVKFDML